MQLYVYLREISFNIYIYIYIYILNFSHKLVNIKVFFFFFLFSIFKHFMLILLNKYYFLHQIAKINKKKKQQ